MPSSRFQRKSKLHFYHYRVCFLTINWVSVALWFQASAVVSVSMYFKLENEKFSARVAVRFFHWFEFPFPSSVSVPCCIQKCIERFRPVYRHQIYLLCAVFYFNLVLPLPSDDPFSYPTCIMLDQTHKQNKYVDLESTFDLVNRRKLHGPLTAEVWTGAVVLKMVVTASCSRLCGKRQLAWVIIVINNSFDLVYSITERTKWVKQ